MGKFQLNTDCAVAGGGAGVKSIMIEKKSCASFFFYSLWSSSSLNTPFLSFNSYPALVSAQFFISTPLCSNFRFFEIASCLEPFFVSEMASIVHLTTFSAKLQSHRRIPALGSTQRFLGQSCFHFTFRINMCVNYQLHPSISQKILCPSNQIIINPQIRQFLSQLCPRNMVKCSFYIHKQSPGYFSTLPNFLYFLVRQIRHIHSGLIFSNTHLSFIKLLINISKMRKLFCYNSFYYFFQAIKKTNNLI